MKNRVLSTLVVIIILPILFLALVFHVDAMYVGYTNRFPELQGKSSACYNGVMSVNGECHVTDKNQMTQENTIYVEDL